MLLFRMQNSEYGYPKQNLVFPCDPDEQSYVYFTILHPNLVPTKKPQTMQGHPHTHKGRPVISYSSTPHVQQNFPSAQAIGRKSNKLKAKSTAHLTAPSGVPSSSPWISRWFSLTRVFSLAGVLAAGSLRLDGDPALPLVEAEWPPEKAGVPREERLPLATLGKLAVLLLPSSITAIASEQEIVGGVILERIE